MQFPRPKCEPLTLKPTPDFDLPLDRRTPAHAANLRRFSGCPLGDCFDKTIRMSPTSVEFRGVAGESQACSRPLVPHLSDPVYRIRMSQLVGSAVVRFKLGSPETVIALTPEILGAN